MFSNRNHITRSRDESLTTQSRSVRISKRKGTALYTTNAPIATGPVPNFMNSVWCCDPSRYPVRICNAPIMSMTICCATNAFRLGFPAALT